MLRQHRPHGIGPVETRMRPQHQRIRILGEDAVDGLGIGMGVQEQPVLLGQLHHAARHRQIGGGAVEMELADADITVAFQAVFQMGDHGLVAEPGGKLAAAAVGPQLRHDQVGRDRIELLGAVIRRAGDQHFRQPRLAAQDCHGLFRRQHVPGVVAVMHMGIDQRPRIALRRYRPGGGHSRQQTQTKKPLFHSRLPGRS
ncbi:hypothetical protein [Ferrovibrio sp.]|uniref:hypothetical protein n=1 Tax=Ferrovibrio sp. TaxID=1917215 RepID=UPI0031200DB4